MIENLIKSKPTKITKNDIKSIKKDGKITIIYPKKFVKIEKWIKNKIGGP